MGHLLCENLETDSTLRALRMAIKRRQYPHHPLIHHSDCGLQYCSSRYTEMLKQHGIQISMTENGDPYENPVAERMNGILKDEFGVDLIKSDLKTTSKITDQSIRTYNNLRPHLSCSMMTPMQMHEQDAVKLKTWRKRK